VIAIDATLPHHARAMPFEPALSTETGPTLRDTYHMTLVLTHACNLACSYCYMGEHHTNRMPVQLAERALSLAFARTRSLSVGFFGGEPLLEHDQLISLAAGARREANANGKSARFQVTTNATLLTERRVQQLVDLDVRVAVSLDGVKQAHDATRRTSAGGSSHEAVVRGVRRMIDTGRPTTVIAVVHPDNVKWLHESVEFLAVLGAHRITLNPCYEAEWSDSDLEIWGDQLNRVAGFWASRMRAGRPIKITNLDNKVIAAAKGGLVDRDRCSVGRRSITVAPSGFLYGCERLVGDDRDPRARLGHIDQGFPEVVSSYTSPAAEDCTSCAERWRCSSHCACANLAESGDPNVPGGVQCWHEQWTANLVDELARAMIVEQCPSMIELAYGNVIDEIDLVDQAYPPLVSNISTPPIEPRHSSSQRRLPLYSEPK
jgi:uncharacterized protein